MENLRKGIVHVLGLSVAPFSVTGGLSLGAEWKAVNAGLTNMDIRSLNKLDRTLNSIAT